MRLKHKLPRKQKITNYEDIALLINDIVESLIWIMPTLNRDCGKVEPPAEFKRDGFLCFSNGTDWDAGSGEGYYYWDEGTSAWVKL